jgi:hypothetical protein
LRVLFSREFSFLDTLVIWDAIFADSCPPGLVDQVRGIFDFSLFGRPARLDLPKSVAVG